MMLSRETFRNAINFIQIRGEKEEELTNLFNENFGDSYLFFCSDYATELIKVLEEATYDKENDWISYFCWELDFGKRWVPGTVMQDGKDIPLETVDDLYNLLEDEYMNR